MGKRIAVSFEEENVKVVHAAFRGGDAYIEKAEIFGYDELDAYLSREKATEFIVTYDFKEAFHGTLQIPVTKARYQKALIESELRKVTKLQRLSFIYTPLGEKTEKGRRLLEVFYFAVSDEVIQDVVSRFYDAGKTVRAVYPTVFSAAALLKSVEDEGLQMGIFGTGMEKIVFLVKNGEVNFIRNYESLDDDLSDFDIQNINMTISFCYQNFRMNPSSLILIGDLAGSSGFNVFPTVPVLAPLMPERVRCDREDFKKFFLPIASLFAPRSANILSGYFRNTNLLKKAVSTMAAVFAAAVIISGAMTIAEINEIYRIRSSIEAARPDRSEVESIYSAYLRKQGDFENVMPLIGFMNQKRGQISGLISGLSGLPLGGLRFRSMDASATENAGYRVTITGVGESDDYSGLQGSFRRLINALNGRAGIKVRDRVLNLSGRSFRIELEYRSEG